MSSIKNRKCAKCGATPEQDDSFSFHRFPCPGSTNLLRATAWATYCWPDKDWSTIESLIGIYRQCKVLCGRHFEESAFIDSNRKKIRRHSVPGTRESVVKLLDELHNKIPSLVKQVHNVDIFSALRPDELQEDPRSLSPEQDIEDNVHNADILSDLRLDELPEDPCSPSPEQVIEDNICRICLQTSSKLISIESYGLRTAYEQLTGVSVEHDDGLPRELCVECATLLVKYHKFRDKSIKGDQLLRQIYDKDGVTEKFPLEELEEVIMNLASKIDFCAEITCIDIDPEETESKVPDKKDDNIDLAKTNDNTVIETDLDMSVDEPAEEEWLTLSDDNDDIRSPTVTSVHDNDDEVSIKEEELDLDGDHTDPLESEHVHIQPEIPNKSVFEQPEKQHKSLVKHPQTQLLSLLQQLKTRNSLVKQPKTLNISLVTYPETQLISLVKHPKTQKISLPVKHLETQNTSLVKDRETQHISLIKHPETQHISIVKHSETQHISIVKHSETQNTSLVKDSETQNISLVKDLETQHIGLVKDTKTQQESVIKAYYCIHKLDVRDQKLKHIRKRMLADYLISKYKCKLCYEGFNTENAKNSHKVHDVDQGDVTCTICQSRFREPKDLKEHSEDVHQCIFNCRICKCDIPTRSLALRHIKKHLPCIRLNN